MKQLVASYRTGELAVLEVPPPAVLRGGVLVRNRASLISAGTERAAIELARKGLLGKARARPDLVRRFFDKVSRDGLIPATKAALARLEEPVALGYSSAGEVVALGEEAAEFRPGDRVACGGAGHACHAEFVFVPKNLCARVPAGVSFESAAFVAVGAAALHAFRLSGAGLGERVAVIGVGLVGQLALQIARAAGARAVAVDVDPSRVALARELGAELAFTPEDLGPAASADAVLVCAAGESNDAIDLAARVAREKARVVVVGDVGLDVPRREFYRKELELVVSRSYGPGRYDPAYEEKGLDYPSSYVRWTEKRNFEEFLALVASGGVTPEKLVTHRFDIERALEGYDLVTKGGQASLGVIIAYPGEAAPARQARINLRPARAKSGRLGLGLIGAGAFARAVLLPELSRLKRVRLRGVATASGMTARDAAHRFGFEYCASEAEEILKDEETDAVLIATRHATHAELTARALDAGKAVFVEKPLAIDRAGVERVREAFLKAGRPLMVGFNRRFSRLAGELRKHLASARPLVMHCTVNAGPAPPDHWTNDPAEGGRVLGELGHFVDLMCFLCGAPPVLVSAASAAANDVQAVFRFSDGSTGSVLYTALGDASHAKERVEVFAGGAAFVLEDFRRLTTVRGGRRRVRKSVQDKGHRAELRAFVEAARDGEMPVPFETVRAVTLATLAAAESAASGKPVCIEES